jgi:ParB family chromosome partitioning protein
MTKRTDPTPPAPVARNYDYHLTDIMQPSYTPGVAELDDARAIDVTLIDRNPNQPRRAFDPAALDELAASIRRHGVLQPILVRPAGARYQLIAGERRWRAAQLAGLEAVPSIVRTIGDDDEVEVLALLENVHRQDLDPLDEAHAYDRLLQRLRLSKRGLAESLDLNHTRVNNRLLLIENPAIEDAVRTGALGVTAAHELVHGLF